MNISSINSGQGIYQTFANKISRAGNKDAEASTIRKSLLPDVFPLRDRQINLIKKTSGDDKAAERLLRDYSKPESGGILVSVSGMPDLKNTEAVRRFQRINQLFEQENKQVESLKSDIISQGKNEGKKAQDILYDLVKMYDSQSELFKLGRGWEGDLFSFNNSSAEGWSKTLQYTPDVIDTKV
ncbi:MAG TPA: hypothetical protein ENI88_02285 [Desulfobulbus sp.]|nr:hypothetical protein [Desulfobulbus sp.]